VPVHQVTGPPQMGQQVGRHAQFGGHATSMGVKGASIQIMPLTWDSFLLPSWTSTPWLTIWLVLRRAAARLAIQDLSA
jgi:hypothetical protein